MGNMGMWFAWVTELIARFGAAWFFIVFAGGYCIVVSIIGMVVELSRGSKRQKH
jgi:hypothetical protein